MANFLISISKKIGYVIAGFILIAALFISTVRLITPVLDAHRDDFEKWASQLLEMPVTIKQVRVSWYQYEPEISLNEVTILNKETKHPILQIQKVRVFLSLIQSLWQRKPIPSSIMISGTDVNLRQTEKGEMSVQGFPALGGFNNQPYQSETKFGDMMAWLSMQPRLVLQNIDVRYTPAIGQKRFVTLYNLSIANFNEKHVLLGKAILHQDLPTELTLDIQWQGNSNDLEKIKAKAYFYVSGLSLDQWLQARSWNTWQVKQGIVSAKVWMTWNHGAFQKIQTEFQLLNVDLYSATDKTQHKINRLSGEVGWKREGKNYILAGQDILIDLPFHLWPVTSFYISLTPEGESFAPKMINIGYADIHDIQSLLHGFPLFAASQKMLSELQLRGSLQNISVSFATPWTDWQHAALNANFMQVNFLPWHHFPGIHHLAGLIKWNNSQGNLIINSKDVLFHYEDIFLQPIEINQLTGTIDLKQDQNQAWLFNIPLLSVLNNDTAMNISGKVTLPSTHIPVTDLQANFTMQNAHHITRYLPMQIFDAELKMWLQKAFLSGEVQSGHAELRGPLNDFPFEQQTGSFLISGVVNNVNLHYAPGWPDLQHTSGKLTFSGRRMSVDIDHAEIQTIPIGKVHAAIPYLGDKQPQILEIESSPIQTDFKQGLQFLHSSPLEKTIGKLFTSVKVSGPTELKLGLTIPLKHPDKTKVNGELIVKEAELNMQPWHLILTKLNGKLHFTENTLEAPDLSGQLFKNVFKLNLTTLQKTMSKSIVQATIATHIDMTDVEKWLKYPLAKAQGGTDVTGKINFSLNSLVTVQLNSNLTGVTLDLPDQYGKSAHEARDFSANIGIASQQPLRVKMRYGDLLNAALILEKKNEKFNLIGANLHLGRGEADWPLTSGLYITGNFEQLDWENIKKYTGQSNDTRFSSLALRAIDIRTKILTILGQRLTQVEFHVTPKQSGWDITISSPEITGHILAPLHMSKTNQMILEFQKLKLNATTASKQSTVIDINTLPTINFTANEVIYKNIPLGKINFKTSPSANGFHIDTLTINSPRINLEASGNWMQINHRDVTHLEGAATSSNVSHLLSSFGFDVHNFISNKGKFTFNLDWRNIPFSPELRSMNGSASLALAQGRIVDINQTSGTKMDIGKMLSIFSLQTLPRRLSFDFSDVFQKGYTFDSLQGHFNLKNGDAYTSDTRFEGSIARVAINGRIGLMKKDYDFILSVTPYITSSVPVAATLITLNPLVGVAAFAVNKVVGSAVSQVTTYYYSVTGPWSNPTYRAASSIKAH